MVGMVFKSYFDGYLVLFEPHFKRNYIHVRDVSKAIMHMINNFMKLQNVKYVGIAFSTWSFKKIVLTS